MPIAFSCPECGTSTQVAEQYAGQSGPCKSCGATVTVPLPAGKVPAPKAASGGVVLMVGLLVGGLTIFLVGGLLVALLLPATSAAREAARRMQCGNNLKQIGLAMHNYHDVYGSFPPAYTVDEEGNKLHSWRTLILPFIEQAYIYDQIDLDKPWDAPENIAFAETPIAVFRCPTDPSNLPAATNYLAVVGDNTVFSGSTGTKMQQITDGTANTILVVEVSGNTSSWMEPADLDYDKMQMIVNGGTNEMGSSHPGGAQVVFADGSVHFIAETVDTNTTRAMITRDGGEAATMPY